MFRWPQVQPGPLHQNPCLQVLTLRFLGPVHLQSYLQLTATSKGTHQGTLHLHQKFTVLEQYTGQQEWRIGD